jgi:hypothetical protein
MSENSVYDTPNSELLTTRKGELFAKGKVVIYDKDVEWPDRCYKCNQATSLKHPVKLSYLNPWFYLSILVSPLLLLVLALIFQKKFPLDLPICSEHLQKRKKHVAINWGITALVVLSFGFGITFNADFGIIAGAVLIVALVLSLVIGRMVFAAKFKDDQLWVRGSGKAFIDSLTEY